MHAYFLPNVQDYLLYILETLNGDRTGGEADFTVSV